MNYFAFFLFFCVVRVGAQTVESYHGFCESFCHVYSPTESLCDSFCSKPYVYDFMLISKRHEAPLHYCLLDSCESICFLYEKPVKCAELCTSNRFAKKIARGCRQKCASSSDINHCVFQCILPNRNVSDPVSYPPLLRYAFSSEFGRPLIYYSRIYLAHLDGFQEGLVFLPRHLKKMKPNAIRLQRSSRKLVEECREVYIDNVQFLNVNYRLIGKIDINCGKFIVKKKLTSRFLKGKSVKKSFEFRLSPLLFMGRDHMNHQTFVDYFGGDEEHIFELKNTQSFNNKMNSILESIIEYNQFDIKSPSFYQFLLPYYFQNCLNGIFEQLNRSNCADLVSVFDFYRKRENYLSDRKIVPFALGDDSLYIDYTDVDSIFVKNRFNTPVFVNKTILRHKSYSSEAFQWKYVSLNNGIFLSASFPNFYSLMDVIFENDQDTIDFRVNGDDLCVYQNIIVPRQRFLAMEKEMFKIDLFSYSTKAPRVCNQIRLVRIEDSEDDNVFYFFDLNSQKFVSFKDNILILTSFFTKISAFQAVIV
ncbi:hypothetical protein PCE1_004391 [Barthelona sp. PCE]